MSDQPNKPSDPRAPKPATPAQPPSAPVSPVAPPVTPSPPSVAPPPVAPTPPPAAPAMPAPAVPPPVAPSAAPVAVPPAFAPPPTDPYGQPAVVPPGGAPTQPIQPVAAPSFGGTTGPPTFDPPATSPTSSSGGRGKGPFIAIGVVLLAVIAGIAAVLVGGGDDGDDDVAVATTVPVATLPDQTTSTTATDGQTDPTVAMDMSASVAELAESTVQILMLDGDTPLCSGSGTIIDDRGTILTNAHVIEPGGNCPYNRIGIAITGDAGLPPELLYIADVYAYDPVVDLAVVRIATDLDGAPAVGPFRPVPIGDSDAVEIGDQLRILGYPGIGGDTVTFTNGVVSGFASQNGIGQRSWIKTDATIAGGNSGGAGFDDAGRLVGIPTQASAGQDGEIVDCRVITDTNGDGQLDGSDQCVPIGGFLNGLRPVNLALPLIEQAVSGGPISIQDEVAAAPGSVVTSDIYVYNPGWTLDASADAGFQPEFVRTATAGAEKLCIWFDWRRLPDGVVWDGIWQVDGVLNESFSFFSEEWASGETGENYWLCALDDTGLAAGLYEFIFYVEGDIIFYESFEVTDTERPLHEVTFVNNSGLQICFLFVAPFGAVDTGLDELGPQEFFEAGASKTIVVPEGSIIADAYDCDFNPIYDQYDGIPVTGALTIDITG